MPRIPILKDQSVVVCDTLSRKGAPVVVVMRAADATPVFWSQSRGDLDGNLDSAGNPQSGIPLLQTDPPLVLLAPIAVLWARANANTFLYVEVMEVNLQTYLGKTSTPGATPYIKPQGPLPSYQEGWKGKY